MKWKISDEFIRHLHEVRKHGGNVGWIWLQLEEVLKKEDFDKLPTPYRRGNKFALPVGRYRVMVRMTNDEIIEVLSLELRFAE